MVDGLEKKRFSIVELLVRPVWRKPIPITSAPAKNPGNNRVTHLALKSRLKPDIVRSMKTKSHTCKWAMALCAAALFSFTVTPAAKADAVSADSPVTPGTVEPYQFGTYGTDPVPPSPETSPVGTFSGTMSLD